MMNWRQVQLHDASLTDTSNRGTCFREIHTMLCHQTPQARISHSGNLPDPFDNTCAILKFISSGPVRVSHLSDLDLLNCVDDIPQSSAPSYDFNLHDLSLAELIQ
jgi:hypothetical protein